MRQQQRKRRASRRWHDEAHDLRSHQLRHLDRIDPAFACNTQYDYWVVKNTYDTLVQYAATPAADGRPIIPALAKSWTISKDGLTYTFKLRRDVNFSSGNPMTADDVVYGLPARPGQEGLSGLRPHAR